MSKFTAQYLVRKPKFDEVVVDISSDAFQEIESAFNFTNKFHYIHSVFETIKDNYHDFESAKFEALHMFVLNGLSYYNLSHDSNFRNINRLLTNLLSSIRKYLDYTNKQLKGTVEDKFKSLSHKEYDGSKSYRFMEQLRNYSQHRDVPVDSITYQHGLNDPSSSEISIFYSIGHYISYEKLQFDGDIKKSVLKEVKELTTKDGFLEVTSFVKDYVTSMYSIHYGLLSHVSEQARLHKEQFRERATEILGEDLYNQGTFIRFFDGTPRSDYSNKLFAVTNELEERFPSTENPLFEVELREVKLN